MIKIDERYHPIEKAPSVKPVDKVNKTKRESEKGRNLAKRKSDELSLEEFLKELE